MKKNLLSFWLMTLMVMLGGINAWAGDKTVVKYSFDDANSPALTAGSRVTFDYDKTSVITSTKFLNAFNNANGDPGASTVSLGSTDLSGETWTLSFEWAACGGCNSKADHTTLKAGSTTLFDLSGNSNWNTTVTITYTGSDGSKTLPVPACNKSYRFSAAVGNQYNTTDYWHHIVVTGSASGVKMTITNSSTGAVVVEDVVLSETNVSPTSLIIEPCCGGGIGIDELLLSYSVEGEVIQTPIANYTAVEGISRTITATCDTEGADLYYSLDGENWTEGAVVTVSESGDVYFKAVKGTSESDILTFAAVAGEAITLNAPTINRSDNTTVTITADQTNLLLSPTATITYEYGNEKNSFQGSKVLTVDADATITAYAECDGYTTSATSERTVALFPENVNEIESAAATKSFEAAALGTEVKTVSERDYVALLLDDAQWGENVYFQNLALTDYWGIRNGGNWYVNSLEPIWILVENLKAGDIVVINADYAASDMVNAEYSEKYSFSNRHAYIVTADGNAEFGVNKINAATMDYLYGVYAYRQDVAKKTIALIPGVWNADGATFAAYAFNSDEDNAWFPFAEVSGAYATQIPDSYAKIIAVRLKPATAENFDATNYGLNWNNKWNQTADIDFTGVADNSVITITGWNAEDYTIGTPVDIETAKAQLTEAIAKAKALNAYANDDNLAAAIATAEAAVTGEDAAAIVAAGTALQTAATTAAKTVLGKAVELGNTIGLDVTAAEDLLAKEDATAEELAAALTALVENAKPAATTMLETAQNFFNTFDKEAATTLAEDFKVANDALGGTDINVMLAAAKALIAKATPAAKTAMEKVMEYFELIDDEPIKTDVTALKAAMEANNLQGIIAAAKQLETDFPAAAVTYVAGVKKIADEKTYGEKGLDELNAAIADAGLVIQAEASTIVQIGAAIRSLVLAVKAYQEANLPEWTATFNNNADPAWEEVYAYAYYQAPEGQEGFAQLLGNWPGKKLEKNAETGLYDVIIKSELQPSIIIFNNGLEGEAKVQTENLPFENGKAYAFVEEAPVETEFAATFKNDADPAWEKVYAYTWTGDGEAKVEQLGAWPGTQLQKNDAGLYVVSDKNATLPEFIIFHNNAGTQTADLAFEEGKQYFYWGEHEFAYKKYVLQNVASGKFWGTGNNWDTQATLVDHPVYQKLVALPDGKYKMETQVSNGGTSYWFSGDYMDSNEDAAVILTITKTEKGYTIANGNNFFGNNTESTVMGKNLAADSKDALWTITTLDDARAAVANGTIEKPTDATVFIEDYNFNRNNRYSNKWTGEIGNNGGNHNGIGEWYMKAAEIYQELSGLPSGVYEMNAQAAVTYHDNRTIKPYDGNGAPVVYATVGETTESSDFIEMIAADQLKDQTLLGQRFTEGEYKIEPIFVQVTNGTLKIGAKSTRTDIWAVWDNFTLTYYGADATIDQVKNAAILAEMQELMAKAEELAKDMENAKVKEALDAAVAQAAAATGAEAINAAIAALKAAIDPAEAVNIAKDILPKMKELVESTNVYTQEAYDEYYGQWLTKYEAGTITKAEASALQDPFLVTQWHASITCDNFLLSAWDTNPDFQDAPYYINTWSTEGVEGSNNYAGVPFGVPFFEYWTGDDGSLGERTLTATMSGLEAGWYEVSALVRVRAKNGYTAPAYGIKLQANDGDMTNVAAGNQVGESQFYQATFTAKGEVGEDGKLYIKFIVAADNNISWLSFKDVKFAATEPVEYTYTVAGGFDTQEGGKEDVIFGTSWTPTLQANDLVKGDDGIYTKTFENVQLNAGTIYYKVVRSHSWDINWGFGEKNADYVVNETGKYNITFTFNPNAPLAESQYNLACELQREVMKGDANLNGEVTVSDAVVAVDFLLENSMPTADQMKAADVDETGTITIADVTAIVNIALEIVPEEGVEAAGARMDAGNNFLSLNGQAVSLTNTVGFVGFQMDVTLADGALLNGAQLTERAAGLNLSYNRIGENTWRIAAFSLQNSVISGNNGALLKLDIAGNKTFDVTNIEFADAAARAYALGFNGDATGINSVNSLNTTATDIYNMNGVRSNTLRKGVNIIRNANGEVKKVFVK